jgi:hypothetical protein
MYVSSFLSYHPLILHLIRSKLVHLHNNDSWVVHHRIAYNPIFMDLPQAHFMGEYNHLVIGTRDGLFGMIGVVTFSNIQERDGRVHLTPVLELWNALGRYLSMTVKNAPITFTTVDNDIVLKRPCRFSYSPHYAQYTDNFQRISMEINPPRRKAEMTPPLLILVGQHPLEP